MTRHLVLPDCQVKPGDSVDHLEWAGKYAAAMRPDVIICIGDFYDFPSLSSYDKGTKSFEGRRYMKDIEAGNHAMNTFMEPIRKVQLKQRRSKKKVWEPRLVYTLGNHEHRIHRAIEQDAMLEDLMSFEKDTNVLDWGWEVHPFLGVVVIDGVAYSHYFCSGPMGRPIGSARMLLTKKFMSCVQGHLQARDIAFATKGDGKQLTAIMAGVYSPHEEGYLNPQTNSHWRGLWVLNEVHDGSFDELPVSLRYLEDKYD